MTIEHVNIADPDIHEPKGVATAASGSAYIANGAGSGSWQGITPNNRVTVNTAADFPAAVAGVITLADSTEYYIGGNNVDIGSDRFAFGTDTTITGSVGPGKITSSTTGTLFTGGDSGLFTVQGVVFDIPTGTLFSVTDTVQGSTTVIFDTCRVIECASLGTFNNILGVNITNNSFLDTDQGFTLTSANTVVTVRQNFMVSTSATFKAVNFGSSTSPTIEIVDLSVNAPAGAVGLAGSASSANVDSGSIALVQSCEFLGGMAATDGNITVNDIRWKFVGNSGIDDTQPDSLLSLTSSSSTTTITTINTPVKVVGTWVSERASHFTNNTNGRATYNGEIGLTTPIDAVLVIDPSAGTNKDFRAYIAINGSVVTNSGNTKRADAGNPQELTLLWQRKLAQNDFVELFIENKTDTTNVIVKDAILRVR